MSGAGDRIKTELLTWPGVTAEPHRFGGMEYRYGRKEIGHVHGDRLADLPFPRRIRDQLVTAGLAEPHHVLPETGWVSRRIASVDEVEEVIALLRINYDRYSTAPADEAEAAEKPTD
jgi:hypothetical protein